MPGGAIGKIDFCGPVTIDTPPHAQLGKLVYLIHLLNGAVTGLALHFPGMYVLRMAEKDVIRQVMNFYPFHRFAIMRIFSFFRVVPRIAVQFFYLFVRIDRGSVNPYEPFPVIYIFIAAYGNSYKNSGTGRRPVCYPRHYRDKAGS